MPRTGPTSKRAYFVVQPKRYMAGSFWARMKSM